MAQKQARPEGIRHNGVAQRGVLLDTNGPPAAATPIPFDQFTGGRVLAPSTIASTTLTFWESDRAGGTYYKCQEGGSDVTATLTGGANESCEIPQACAPSLFLKIQSSADIGEAVTIIKK